MKNFILSAVLLTFLAGCIQVNEFGWEEFHSPVLVHPLIFQSEYTNHAWGYSHNGWMMDGAGLVKRFQKNAPWVFPDSLGYISEIDMQKNLSVCDSLLEHIDPYKQSHYSFKAISCVDGPMSTPKNTMADAGERIYAFYLYESDRKRYKRVILSMTGDWSQENLAPNAKEVVDWMMNIK
ncbi:MAG: hypothetical protein M1445_05775 [Bacteroidetes bacterium]|nr:hypothetical protein [Bacteroidota bacterium]MCL6103959.1 hypothetical protein [Bacteroidota bacterium]